MALIPLPYEQGHVHPAEAQLDFAFLVCANGGAFGQRLTAICSIKRGFFYTVPPPFPPSVIDGRMTSKVQYKALQLRGRLRLPVPPAITQPFAPCSIYLIMDFKHSYQGNPSWFDIFDTDGFNTFLNEDNSERFHLLWEKQVVLGPQEKMEVVVDEYIPLHRYYAEYDDDTSLTSGDPPHMLSGVLYLCTVGSLNWASGNAPHLSCACKLTFWDNILLQE